MSFTQPGLTKQQVAIIIVNWNTGTLLADCLSSIQRARDNHLVSEVIIVDNDSKDDSVEHAQSAARDARIIFIKSGVNLGFAGGNQRASVEIQDKNAHILLLNPDTVIHDDTISGMLDGLTDEKVGIVGAELRNSDGSHQDSVRRFPTVVNFFWLFLKLHRLFPGAKSWQHYMMSDFDYAHPHMVDQVMGAAFLIRRKTWEQLEGLDVGFFVWFEEVDFCLRAKQAGYSTLYTPRPHVTHYGGVSFNQLAGIKRTKPWILSSLRYIGKHFPLVWPIFLAITPLALAIALPLGFIHRHQQRPKTPLV